MKMKMRMMMDGDGSEGDKLLINISPVHPEISTHHHLHPTNGKQSSPK